MRPASSRSSHRLTKLRERYDFPGRLIEGRGLDGRERCRGGITRSVPLTVADQISIAAVGHPARTGKMRVVDQATTSWIEFGIETEQNPYSLAPVGTIASGVEQAEIQSHVLSVIGRQTLAGRWFVKKLRG